MPIQFRCGSCQQLLGIAKRKSGSVVDCPTCHTQTMVPATSTENEMTSPATPPVRRQAAHQPMSIFDKVDVDKLLQKPTRPELVEEASSVAVAPPPVRRKMVFTPDPLLEAQVAEEEEPQAMPRLGTEDAEPVSDEPFALSPVPVLTSNRAARAPWMLSMYLILGGLAVMGAFFAGHWVGSHRPLF